MLKKFRPIKYVITIELISIMVLTTLTLLLGETAFGEKVLGANLEPQSAIAVLVGGTLFVIPNAYFTALAFRYSGAKMAPWIVKSFSRGQSGKIILTMVGFAVVFKSYPDLPVRPLMAAFVVMLVLHICVANTVSKRFSK